MHVLSQISRTDKKLLGKDIFRIWYDKKYFDNDFFRV